MRFCVLVGEGQGKRIGKGRGIGLGHGEVWWAKLAYVDLARRYSFIPLVFLPNVETDKNCNANLDLPFLFFRYSYVKLPSPACCMYNKPNSLAYRYRPGVKAPTSRAPLVTSSATGVQQLSASWFLVTRTYTIHHGSKISCKDHWVPRTRRSLPCCRRKAQDKHRCASRVAEPHRDRGAATGQYTPMKRKHHQT